MKPQGGSCSAIILNAVRHKCSQVHNIMNSGQHLEQLLKPAMFDHVGKQEHKVFPEEKASLFLKKQEGKKQKEKQQTARACS